jgi:hypothetical protein
MTNLTIKSFINNVAVVSYGEEYYDKEIVVPDEYLIEGVLNESDFLLYASGFTPDEVEQIDTSDIVEYGIPKIHLPSYITEQVVIDQVNELADAGKIILNSTNPDYVIKLNKSLDILEHQSITDPHTDNYTYFYNRILFLRHFKAYLLSFGASIIEPIKYLVPSSIEQIQNFIEPNKEYLVYESLDFDNAITLNYNNIVDYFSNDKLLQNISNRNFISMRYDRQAWCIEEKHIPEHSAKGYVYRVPNLRKFDYSLGVGINYYNVVEEDEANLSNIISFMFYYYATPFNISYKKVGDKILVCDIDLSIHTDNPAIEKIYANSNIPN